MKTKALIVACTLCVSSFATVSAQNLQLNGLEYFETRGENVLVYSNTFSGGFNDEKNSGIEIIHHGVRTVQAGASVTLQECRDLARRNYPLVRRYDLIHATQECNVHNASLAWLPRLEIGGGGAWFNDVLNAADFVDILGTMSSSLPDLSDKKEQPWQYKVSATVSQNVWDGGASALVKETAKATAAKEESELEVSLYELQKQVDQVFFSILLLEERLKQECSRIEVLDSNLAKMRAFYQDGGLSAMELKSMEAESKSAGQHIRLIENNIRSSRLSLSLLTSADMSEQELVTPDGPETFPLRPEYAYLENSRRLLELGMKKLNVDLSPKIALMADAYYGYPGRDIFKALTDYNPSLNLMLGVQLKFNIDPLYTRKNDKTLIYQQMHELDIQKDLLDFKTKLSNSGISQEILFLRQTLEDDSEILQLRTEVRMAAQERLDNGVIDAYTLLQKINEEAEASLQKSIHKIELLQALYRQERTE